MHTGAPTAPRRKQAVRSRKNSSITGIGAAPFGAAPYLSSGRNLPRVIFPLGFRA